MTLPTGGKAMTQYLVSLFANAPPRLKASTGEAVVVTEEIAEEIKLADITNISPLSLKEAQKHNMAKEEGVDDIAQIVASGKMAEYIQRKEKEKAARAASGGQSNASSANKQNQDRVQTSYLTLKDGREIFVGPERFRVADELFHGKDGVLGLIDAISLVIETTLAVIDIGLERKPDFWQNIVIVGGGARIKGMA